MKSDSVFVLLPLHNNNAKLQRSETWDGSKGEETDA